VIRREHEGDAETHPLPPEGTVIVGRGPGVDVVIEHASVSRRHAALHVAAGGDLEVEDLGSSNGTRLMAWHRGPAAPRGQPVAETDRRDVEEHAIEAHQRVRVARGQVIKLGTVAVVATRAGAIAQRCWSHSYFDRRLADACARSARDRTPLSLVRLRAPGAHGDAPGLERTLGELAPSQCVLGAYAPDEYEVLYPGAGRREARALATRIVAALGERDLAARVAIASYPEDGRSPHALQARASSRLEGVEERDEAGAPPVVKSPVMLELWTIVERVAPSILPVLLLGETGVGKEVVAEGVHKSSRRAAAPFVALNCGALSESLLESELFGHERGAFTGATHAKPGLLETANGGTLFLDEVGELSPTLQVKLLRVLEERRVLPVGAVTARATDVRFIAATNKDLGSDVEAGRFRSDLFFRLSGLVLSIPPLRERRDEIEPLLRRFLADACRRAGISSEPTVTPEAWAWLRAHDWPGNVRELRNIVERALLLCAGGPIGLEHLGAPLASSASVRNAAAGPVTLRPPSSSARVDAANPSPQQLREMLGSAQRDETIRALDACAGNQTRAAKMLGISRGTLLARLDAYALPRPRQRRGT
jgi:DNA-binding NtrC family response regulator